MLIERDSTRIVGLFAGPIGDDEQPVQVVALQPSAVTAMTQKTGTLTIYAPPLKITVRGTDERLTEIRTNYLRGILSAAVP